MLNAFKKLLLFHFVVVGLRGSGDLICIIMYPTSKQGAEDQHTKPKVLLLAKFFSSLLFFLISSRQNIASSSSRVQPSGKRTQDSFYKEVASVFSNRNDLNTNVLHG